MASRDKLINNMSTTGELADAVNSYIGTDGLTFNPALTFDEDKEFAPFTVVSPITFSLSGTQFGKTVQSFIFDNTENYDYIFPSEFILISSLPSEGGRHRCLMIYNNANEVWVNFLGTQSTLPTLDTPTNLSVSNITENSLDLSWDSVANAESYNILIDGIFYQNVSTPPSSIISLSPGTTYELSVIAIAQGFTQSLPGTINATTNGSQSDLISWEFISDVTGLTSNGDGNIESINTVVVGSGAYSGFSQIIESNEGAIIEFEVTSSPSITNSGCICLRPTQTTLYNSGDEFRIAFGIQSDGTAIQLVDGSSQTLTGEYIQNAIYRLVVPPNGSGFGELQKDVGGGFVKIADLTSEISNDCYVIFTGLSNFFGADFDQIKKLPYA